MRTAPMKRVPTRRPRSEPATAVTPSGRRTVDSSTAKGGPAGGPGTTALLPLGVGAGDGGRGACASAGGTSSAVDGRSALSAIGRGAATQPAMALSLTGTAAGL